MSEPVLEPILIDGTVETIVNRLRDAIEKGAFSPGQQLRETGLAQQLNVSRSPVREAMQRLIQEGLLYRVRNRGVFVVELSEADMDDISVARQAVEKTAAKELARNPRKQIFDELHRVIVEMKAASESGRPWSDLVDLDLEFHTVLVGSLGSKRLMAFYQTLLTETRMSLMMLEDAYPHPEEIAAEHRQLLLTVKGGNLGDLDDQIKQHMDHSAQRRQSMGNRAS
ncbi:GntR family transcriptional regulator [Arthrobacter sp. GCM10027362]|uniref:GntR family transcriptional regulator n=1 Tax=Arthrobacter sp. GCM10027362 TaxID=3273379 RepID=UPI003640DEA4